MERWSPLTPMVGAIRRPIRDIPDERAVRPALIQGDIKIDPSTRIKKVMGGVGLAASLRTTHRIERSVVAFDWRHFFSSGTSGPGRPGAMEKSLKTSSSLAQR